ncbi:unnamed protein product [Spodoptera littoralis]|uniref:Uncharacterized protein n=1 Tax=Spodoptera littoralis TaxID=7109 RepID=A0A9P0N6Z6_SPOLI|nr:unnamed protein product [Spodoptera littoralis]CAH1643775.1 unnamed protein product [Spodoptera littoralis]
MSKHPNTARAPQRSRSRRRGDRGDANNIRISTNKYTRYGSASISTSIYNLTSILHKPDSHKLEQAMNKVLITENYVLINTRKQCTGHFRSLNSESLIFNCLTKIRITTKFSGHRAASTLTLRDLYKYHSVLGQ